jgi:phage terminase Nu1 subunit (DNA packaging protein)
MTKAKRPRASTKDVCDAFGVSRRTVTKWAGSGCPHEKARGGNRFDLRAVQRWREERDRANADAGVGGTPPPVAPGTRDALNEAKLRKETAAARRVELIVGKLEGELVERAEVEAAFVRACAAFRSLVLAVPARCAPVVADLVEAVEVERLLRLELEEVLRQLADRPVVPVDGNGAAA